MKFKTVLAFFLVANSVLAAPTYMQSGLLIKLPGASKDLNAKLECLRNKVYPNDIAHCGLNGFPNRAYQDSIEKCLNSGVGRLVPLVTAPNGNLSRVMMLVECKKMRIAAEFDEDAGSYSLKQITELVD